MKNQLTQIATKEKAAAHESARIILDNLPDAVVLVDKALTLVSFNHCAKERARQHLKKNIHAGMPLIELVPPARWPALSTIIKDVLSGKSRVTESHSLSRYEGEKIYENSFSPARDKSGEIVGILIRSVDITPHKNAERAMQEAEERWQFAFEASNQAAWDWNMQTNEVIYSSSYKKLYGFLGDDLKNELSEWQNRIHPEDKGRIEKAVEEHTQSDNPYYETTYRIQLKNGDYKWIMARGKLLSKDEEGKPLRMIGTHTDLTQTMQTKAEIRKMNERFHYATKASSQALWEWDAQTGEAYVSPSFTEMFGWDVDENKHFDQWHQYIHPNDQKETIETYYHTLRHTNESIWQATYRFLRADGSYVFVSDKAYILRNKKNEAIKVIGATLDVTALKKTEAELLKSNERYNIVIKATNELLWEWDLKTGEVYRHKEGIKKVYGLEDNSLVKTVALWMERIHPDDVGMVRQVMQSVMEGGEHMQTFEIEYRFQTGDGRYNDILGRGILLKDENGQPVRMIGSEQNISLRKRLERELLQNELEMKKRINQATVDSQEQERSEIGRELHDNINQVLTTTKLYLELAAANDEVAEELLKKSCVNIGNVIHEIRQLSRSLMDPTLGDLGIVDSINDLVGNLNFTKKVRITLDIEEAIENTLDKNQKLTIFRILQESLNNVVKHAGANFVTVSIGYNNDNIYLQVKDDGIGFLPESVKKGAGLKNITNRVYLINGHFAIESTPGNGSTVKINFPIKRTL